MDRPLPLSPAAGEHGAPAVSLPRAVTDIEPRAAIDRLIPAAMNRTRR